jgi:hypothetical protein
LITVILTAISKKYEVKAGKNIFFKKSAFSDTADDIGDESKQVHTEKVYNINQNNSEVAEKIRKLLGEDHEEK